MFVKSFFNYFYLDYLFQEQSYASGEKLIKELSQYSSCKAMIEEALAVIQKLGLAALEVRFEPVKSGFNSEQEGNIIRIRPDLSPGRQRYAFIMGLTNLIQHEKHLEVGKLAAKGIYKNEEEYARAEVFIAYNGLKRTAAICRTINKLQRRAFTSYFEDLYEQFPIKIMEFDLCYTSVFSDAYKEYYRDYWRKFYKAESSSVKSLNDVKKPVSDSKRFLDCRWDLLGYLFPEKSYTSGEALIKELSQYSPCKTIIEEALTVIRKLGLAALEVRFEPTKSGFRAEQDGNIIRIQPDLSASIQRFSFIFELTNLIQHEKHQEINKLALNGIYKNEEEYARAKEFIEFNGIKRAVKISRAMNKYRGVIYTPYFEEVWNLLSIKTMEFDFYYTSFVRKDHKEYYRSWWRKVDASRNFNKTSSKSSL